MAEHGTISKYTNEKCHCDECKAAWRRYRARYDMGRRRQMMTARDVRKHLRFLLTHGWSQRTLASELGIDRSHLRKIADGAIKHVSRELGNKILAAHTFEAPYKGRAPLGRTPKWATPASA